MSRSIPYSIRKHPPGSPARREAAWAIVERILEDLEGLALPPVDVARQSRRLRELLPEIGAQR